jgi:hypothetical protein
MTQLLPAKVQDYNYILAQCLFAQFCKATHILGEDEGLVHTLFFYSMLEKEGGVRTSKKVQIEMREPLYDSSTRLEHQ